VDIIDELLDAWKTKPQPVPPPKGATIGELVANWEHNYKVKESK